jgi:hypothetical protein
MSLFRYVNINKPDRISLRKVFELMKINLFLLHIIRGHKFLRGVVPKLSEALLLCNFEDARKIKQNEILLFFGTQLVPNLPKFLISL